MCDRCPSPAASPQDWKRTIGAEDVVVGDAGDDMRFGGNGLDVVEGGAGDDFIDTGLLGGNWPLPDRDPDDTQVGQSIDINYTPVQLVPLGRGG